MTLYYCKCPDSFPFYIIQDNLSIIPIHESNMLSNYLYNISYDESNKSLKSEKTFKVYNPSGPRIMNAIVKNDS